MGQRGGYYEEAGALRDMVQNHLLQVLSLVAMEPPVSLQAERGRRRAALIEDGLTLCDVCAPSGNHQPIRFEV